jgi:hypothetical protein
MRRSCNSDAPSSALATFPEVFEDAALTGRLFDKKRLPARVLLAYREQ